MVDKNPSWSEDHHNAEKDGDADSDGEIVVNISLTDLHTFDLRPLSLPPDRRTGHDNAAAGISNIDADDDAAAAVECPAANTVWVVDVFYSRARGWQCSGYAYD